MRRESGIEAGACRWISCPITQQPFCAREADVRLAIDQALVDDATSAADLTASLVKSLLLATAALSRRLSSWRQCSPTPTSRRWNPPIAASS